MLFDDGDDGGGAHEDGEQTKKGKQSVTPPGLTVSSINTPRVRRVLHHLFVLGLILCFAFVVEHTDVVPSAKKAYDIDFFWFLAALLLLASIFTITKSRGNADILNRDQTEEWKGWMQFLFLRNHTRMLTLFSVSVLYVFELLLLFVRSFIEQNIFIVYHYQHAVDVYNLIRVFVSCYVWMTGFGNFSFFYMRADYSFSRFVQMMWRLNFLVICLMLVMGTNYILYYIVPVKFYYVVLFC